MGFHVVQVYTAEPALQQREESDGHHQCTALIALAGEGRAASVQRFRAVEISGSHTTESVLGPLQ